MYLCKFYALISNDKHVPYQPLLAMKKHHYVSKQTILFIKKSIGHGIRRIYQCKTLSLPNFIHLATYLPNGC